MMRSLLILLTALPLHADQISDYWFNGAEISSFELSQSRYGETHPGHAELVFVTEPFLTEKQVKNESGKGEATDVLKLNSLTTYNTGIYSYRTMTSTFRPIDLEKFPHALKSSTSVQDWCGQAFQQYNLRKNGWSVEIRSYFEEPGDQDLTLPEAFLEDELWITLRLDPKSLPTGETEIIPGALYTRYSHGDSKPTKVTAKLSESGETSTYSLQYPTLDRNLTITFDNAFPHVIREWTDKSPSGTTKAVLKKRLMHIPYWNLKKVKDSERRKELGLDPVAN